jgi:hypothetical protein
LLYDEGEMILESTQVVNESEEKYMIEKRLTEKLENELAHYKELLKSKEETIAILKHQLGITE